MVVTDGGGRLANPAASQLWVRSLLHGERSHRNCKLQATLPASARAAANAGPWRTSCGLGAVGKLKIRFTDLRPELPAHPRAAQRAPWRAAAASPRQSQTTTRTHGEGGLDRARPDGAGCRSSASRFVGGRLQHLGRQPVCLPDAVMHGALGVVHHHCAALATRAPLSCGADTAATG